MSADYYQNPGEFSGVMTALVGRGSAIIRGMRGSRRCVLVVHQAPHRYRVPCALEVLVPEHPLYQLTYWHNANFNPNIPADVSVIAFRPSWTQMLR